jgi:hypothetical protein
MTDVAIYARVLIAVALDTPAHALVYLAPHYTHLSNIAVAGDAINAGADVRLMYEKDLRRIFYPKDALPGRLLALFSKGGESLHLRALCLD